MGRKFSRPKRRKRNPLNLNQITDPLRQIFAIAAMLMAAAALLKLSGFVSIRFSVMELAAVAIACALAK